MLRQKCQNSRQSNRAVTLQSVMKQKTTEVYIKMGYHFAQPLFYNPAQLMIVEYGETVGVENGLGHDQDLTRENTRGDDQEKTWITKRSAKWFW